MELMVVVAIIGLLVGLVVPGAASLWAQRNEAGSINLVRGLLESARSQARRSGERGLFFFVDPIDNVQRIAFIEAEPPNTPDAVGNVLDQSDCVASGSDPNCVSAPMAVNRFRVTDDKTYTVPPPYRVAPAEVLDWSAAIVDQVANYEVAQKRLGSDWLTQLTNSDPAPAQRNHFTVIFNRSGQIQVGRDVLVHDPDSPANIAKRDNIGDKTKMTVTDVGGARRYYAYNNGLDMSPSEEPIDPNNQEALSSMICDQDGVALNFPSVDGLVVYDNSVVEGLDGNRADSDRGLQAGQILADELLTDGRPVYVSKQTGDIILGEKGR